MTSKTPATKHCFPRRHLTPNECALYNYMWAASRASGEFRSDARRDAWDLGVNKDSITSWTKSLAKKGWAEQTQKRRRNPVTGAYSPIHYRVLSHAEWVGKHGSAQCRYLEDYYQQHRERHAPDGEMENVQNQELEDNRLSDRIGQEPDRHQSDETGQALSETTRSTCPKRAVPPVRPFRTKRVVKKVSKESEKEKPENHPPSSSNPPTAVPKEKNQSPRLADITVTTAIETNPAASFSGKSKAEIVRVIEETNPTEEELVSIVRAIVNQLDDFQLRNAGSAIAASLAGHIMAMRKKKTEADNHAVVHEKEMRVVQEEIAARERDMKETMAKAKAEEDRLRRHYPDDGFCACPTCQPEFWKQGDAFEERASA